MEKENTEGRLIVASFPEQNQNSSSCIRHIRLTTIEWRNHASRHTEMRQMKCALGWLISVAMADKRFARSLEMHKILRYA